MNIKKLFARNNIFNKRIPNMNICLYEYVYLSLSIHVYIFNFSFDLVFLKGFGQI